MSDNGWNEYRKLVIDRLDKLDERVQNIQQGQIDILSRLSVFKYRSFIMGALGGAVVFILMLLGLGLEGVMKILKHIAF